MFCLSKQQNVRHACIILDSELAKILRLKSYTTYCGFIYDLSLSFPQILRNHRIQYENARAKFQIFTHVFPLLLLLPVSCVYMSKAFFLKKKTSYIFIHFVLTHPCGRNVIIAVSVCRS